VPVFDLVESLTVLVAVLGGRKDTEVTGRVYMRRVETGPIRWTVGPARRRFSLGLTQMHDAWPD
jgi:hypothetical protein